jgi:hypothetical protein
MKKFAPKLLAFVVSLVMSNAGYALAQGSAQITGCAPAGGMKGKCKVTKSVGDPQISHSKNCRLTIDNVIVPGQDYSGGNDSHSSGNSSHTFPSPDLQADFEECVEFKVHNLSYWWNPSVSAWGDDTRNTFCD